MQIRGQRQRAFTDNVIRNPYGALRHDGWFFFARRFGHNFRSRQFHLLIPGRRLDDRILCRLGRDAGGYLQNQSRVQIVFTIKINSCIVNQNSDNGFTRFSAVHALRLNVAESGATNFLKRLTHVFAGNGRYQCAGFLDRRGFGWRGKLHLFGRQFGGHLWFVCRRRSLL